jgi:uncharacterized membrane protein
MLALAGSSACEDSDPAGPSERDSEGMESEGEPLAPCDEQPVVSYDTFGRGFLATYCDGCHGSEVVERQDAPEDVVFDTREGAEQWADRILARSAPENGEPATMPPVGGVTPEDTVRLRVWLTCWQ